MSNFFQLFVCGLRSVLSFTVQITAGTHHSHVFQPSPRATLNCIEHTKHCSDLIFRFISNLCNFFHCRSVLVGSDMVCLHIDLRFLWTVFLFQYHMFCYIATMGTSHSQLKNRKIKSMHQNIFSLTRLFHLLLCCFSQKFLYPSLQKFL